MKKVDYPGRGKDEVILCSECGKLVIVGENVWMNIYTEELAIFCANCKIPIGGIISD